jgi:hypothetical protein
MDNGRSGNGESGDVVKSTPTASELLTVTYFHLTAIQTSYYWLLYIQAPIINHYNPLIH